MCFDLDSEAPVPAIKGAAISHDDLVLDAADGNRFAAFRASPEDTSLNVGVVILPDVRGLYRFYEELALRFAERGYHAIAIDHFGRTAGIGKRGDDFDYTEHVNKTTRGSDPGGRARRGGAHVRGRLPRGVHRQVLLRRSPILTRGGVRPRARRGGRLLRQSRGAR